MFPSIHETNQPKCTFETKGKFATNLELAFARNQVRASQQPKVPTEREYWTKQPPDFSYKLYITPAPLGKPPRKSKGLTKKNASTFDEELHSIRSRLFAPVIGQADRPEIITRVPHVGPYEAQLMFVKMGKFKSSKYQDPKPYDYRQYEQDLPDFVTSYARDPLNLKFKSQCLSKVHGLSSFTEEKRGSRLKEKFITYKPKELKWDSRLLLPKEPWPTKSGSFTRHRSQRGAHSAFMDRVEETLSKLWMKEASQKQAESRRKAADIKKQKTSNVAIPAVKEQQAKEQQEKSLPKERLSQSTSKGQLGWGMADRSHFLLHIKPEPLGFLLPNGIAQTVEELRCKS
ncbi:Cytidylate kinase [Varanus komodoensis]|nr:Cytidylate kinase [Varanus komodoensis]